MDVVAEVKENLSMKPSFQPPSIFDHIDYREFIQEMVRYLKSKGKYSVRPFAKKVGFKSSNYLKTICDGKRNLTASAAERVAAAFKLNSKQTKYFLEMVEFGNAKSVQKQRLSFERMLTMRRAQGVKELNEDGLKLFSHWFITVIAEALNSSWKEKSTSEMADSLGVTEKDVEFGVRTLKDLGLIENVNGQWVPTNRSVTTGNAPNSLILRNYHKQMIQKALNSLDRVSVNKRHAGGLTIALDKESFELLLEKIGDFNAEVNARFSELKNPSDVYQLNIQLFPLVNLE